MIRLPVALQGRQILTAAVLGLALAAVYDLLRGIRRLRPGWTGLMDLVFGVFLLVGLMWFMLYLRLNDFCLCFSILWFCVFSVTVNFR